MSIFRRLSPTIDGASVTLGDGTVKVRRVEIPAGEYETPFWIRPDGDADRAVHVTSLPWAATVRAGALEVRSTNSDNNPGKPTNVSVSQVSSTETDVTYQASWDDVSFEDGYEWQAGGDTGEWSEPASGWNELGAGVTSVQFTVDRLAEDTESFFCVRAFNTISTSEQQCVGFTLPASESTSAPDAPTNLTATAVEAFQVDLDWTGVSNVESYDIHRSTTQGFTVSGTTFLDEVGGASTTYSDTTTAGDTTYYYRVVASNSAGDSAPSNEASATTPSGSTDALLTGATPSSFTTPSGWSVHATEDFEDGTVGNLSKFSTAEIANDRAHTGSWSVANTITGDGQQNGGSVGGDIPSSSREAYVSWWEYVEEEARFNTEFRMGHMLKRDPFQEIVINFRVAGSQQGFNSEIGNYIPVAQGQHSNAYHSEALKNVERPRGRWVQYEWRVRANTPGESDGEYDFWRDGEKLVSMRNVVLNGDRDMTGMRPVIGGTYTKHNWRVESEGCACGDYIGDGASFVGHPCFEPNTTNKVRCKSFSTGCECPPTPPIFRHWIDDIIVLYR